jgi:hypothetical protein
MLVLHSTSLAVNMHMHAYGTACQLPTPVYFLQLTAADQELCRLACVKHGL